MATIKNHQELAAWQRCSELRDRVLAIIARPSVARHVNFCDQIERSARSAPANVAEGFGRYLPRDNARFVRIALGSLRETQDLVDEALRSNYIDQPEHDALSTLIRRAIGTNVRWHTYLKKCPQREPLESASIEQPRSTPGAETSDLPPRDQENASTPNPKTLKL